VLKELANPPFIIKEDHCAEGKSNQSRAFLKHTTVDCVIDY
jgi:hypothetical protein